MISKWCEIPTGKCIASDRGQNRYSDFVALETPLRFKNCSSRHSLLFRGVASMSSSCRIPRFFVMLSLGHRWLFLVALLWTYMLLSHFYAFVSSGLPFIDCATYLGRYLMYGDIYCTDFTCIS